MPRIPLVVIALFFLVGGLAHFVFIDFFVKSMPEYMSYHEELVVISGVFEIFGAIGILIPKTRLIAGYGLMALIVAVYPANLNMALHSENYQHISIFLLYARLPLQFIFVGFVWWAIAPERLHIKGVRS